MEVLGIGPSELAFILIIALIVLGPRDMEKAGRTIGKWLRNIVTSDGWKIFQQTSREVRNLPNRLIREANEELDKINTDLNSSIDSGPTRYGPYAPPAGARSVQPLPAPDAPENNIQPPEQPAPKDEPKETDA